MGEEKFASLSSGLLARKGGAKPAMRRQNYINPQGDVSETHDDLGWNDMGHDDGQNEQKPALVNGEEQVEAPVPEVCKQIDELEDNLSHDADKVIKAELPEVSEGSVEHHYAGLTPVGGEDAQTVPATVVPIARVEKPAAIEKPKKKVLARDKKAFTLRLDEDRHLKLRLASAVSNRSAQQIVTEALDRFLETMPNIDNLADETPRSQSN